MGVAKMPINSYKRTYVITDTAIENYRRLVTSHEPSLAWRHPKEIGDAIDVRIKDGIEEGFAIEAIDETGERIRVVKLDDGTEKRVTYAILKRDKAQAATELAVTVIDPRNYRAALASRWKVQEREQTTAARINTPFTKLADLAIEAPPPPHEPPPAAPPPEDRPRETAPMGDNIRKIRQALEAAGADGATGTELAELTEIDRTSSVSSVLLKLLERGVVVAVGKEHSSQRRWYLAEHAPAEAKSFTRTATPLHPGQAAPPIIAALERVGAAGATLADLDRETGLRRGTISQAAIKLVYEGKVRVFGAPKSPTRRYYLASVVPGAAPTQMLVEAPPPAPPRPVAPPTDVHQIAARLADLIVQRTKATRAVAEAEAALAAAKANLERVATETAGAQAELAAAAERA